MKKGWEEKRLGEVCDIIGGGTPSKANSKFYNGEIPWATVRDMKLECIKDTEHKITREAIKKSSTNIIPKGNVIIATRVGLGKICWIENDTAINQDLRGIVPKTAEKISAKYLFQWFKSISYKIEEEGTGATVKGVKLPFIKSLAIPIPPLPEQKRIVKTLDKAFTAIDKAKENAEKNLKNAKELFDSYLQNIFASPGKDWEEKKLETITNKIGSGATPRGGKNEYKAEGLSLIRSLNVYDNGFAYKKLAFINQAQADKLSNVIVESGDVLLNITGASICRCTIVPDDVLPARVNQHVSIIRLKQGVMESKLLWYILISKVHKDRLLTIGEKAGATRQALTKNQLEEYIIYYPRSLTEQKRIVAKLNALSAETKRLESIYQQKISGLEELKQSVLQKAFEGGL